MSTNTTPKFVVRISILIVLFTLLLHGATLNAGVPIIQIQLGIPQPATPDVNQEVKTNLTAYLIDSDTHKEICIDGATWSWAIVSLDSSSDLVCETNWFTDASDESGVYAPCIDVTTSAAHAWITNSACQNAVLHGNFSLPAYWTTTVHATLTLADGTILASGSSDGTPATGSVTVQVGAGLTVTGPQYGMVGQTLHYTVTGGQPPFIWSTLSGDAHPSPSLAGAVCDVTCLRPGQEELIVADNNMFPCKCFAKEGRHDLTIFQIDQNPGDLWWFNGAKPQLYAVKGTLRASGTNGQGTFGWTITQGADKVVLNDGVRDSTTVTKTNDPTVIIKSIGASAPAATITPDVTIQFSYNGTVVGSFKTVVFAPDSLVRDMALDLDLPSVAFGYESHIGYKIFDQFNHVLPNMIEINEKWTGAVQPKYTGMNWRRGPAAGETIDPSGWIDVIDGENLLLPPVPLPVAPTDANAGVEVYLWPGVWNIGSTTVGDGTTVLSLVWDKFRGYARHH